MQVFVAIIEDRHTDVDIELFPTAEEAIEYAKECVQGNARHPENIEEETIQGCLYYCRYSSEGDCVSVVEKELIVD